ncbi:MAG: 6-phosphofructokinase [Oscillospiraceae bacterium]
MSELQGACMIAQSGGPTAVINASAQGLIQTALKSKCITKVLGAANGIQGVLTDTLYDMSYEDTRELELLRYTPASALGASRYKLPPAEEDDTDYKRILEIFKKYHVRYFFYNGGNDSMDTCYKISTYMQRVGYECRVIGVPKTIDNDLMGTDHCPGYGSAAKFIATVCMEVHRDAYVYDPGAVTIIEIMGRHAGWLAGAAGLASWAGGGPDLIYLPEVPFDMADFLSRVEQIYEKKHKCLVAVSEGIRYADGTYVFNTKASSTDGFGHEQLGGLAVMLAAAAGERTGAKARGVELSLLQRCASHCASRTDMDEAFWAGQSAVEAAVSGITDKMVGFSCTRENGKYTCDIKLIDLKNVANLEQTVPLDWIKADGTGVEQAFIDYVLPLIHGELNPPKEYALPRFARLKKVVAEP